MDTERKIDMKRHEKIDGIQAIKLLLEGERLRSEDGTEFRIDPTFNKLYYVPWGHEVLSDLSFNEIASRDWYVKKPFDVRTEMLARPNEWVGAFRDTHGTWHKVGFDTEFMKAVETPFVSVVKVKINQASVGSSDYEELEKCIPIEDVPQEEWT